MNDEGLLRFVKPFFARDACQYPPKREWAIPGVILARAKRSTLRGNQILQVHPAFRQTSDPLTGIQDLNANNLPFRANIDSHAVVEADNLALYRLFHESNIQGIH